MRRYVCAVQVEQVFAKQTTVEVEAKKSIVTLTESINN